MSSESKEPVCKDSISIEINSDDDSLPDLTFSKKDKKLEEIFSDNKDKYNELNPKNKFHSDIDKDSKNDAKISDECVSETAIKENHNQWSCSSCTFLNYKDLPECEICNTPKKKKVSKKTNSSQESPSQRKRKFTEDKDEPDDSDLESPFAGVKKCKLSDQQRALPLFSFFTKLKDESSVLSRGSAGHCTSTPTRLSETKLRELDVCELKLSPLVTSQPNRCDSPQCDSPDLFDEMSDEEDLSKPSLPMSKKIEDFDKCSTENDFIKVKESHSLTAKTSESESVIFEPEKATKLESLELRKTPQKSCFVKLNQKSPVKQETCDLPKNNESSKNADLLQPSSTEKPPPLPEPSVRHEILKFSCSVYTGRIYVYNQVS